jgi:hypothetical protein
MGAASFKVNFIVDELDRKILINTLKEDFGLLLRNEYPVRQQFDNATDKIYESEDGRYYNYLYESKSQGKLYKIVHSSKRKEKFNISFSSENDIFAERIIIRHRNIKLKIELNSLKNP